jgi:hypothetical protein
VSLPVVLVLVVLLLLLIDFKLILSVLVPLGWLRYGKQHIECLM